MSNLEEGTVVLQMKVHGIYYSLGLELKDYPTEKDLRTGMGYLTQTLFETLNQLRWFSKMSPEANPSDPSHPAEGT